MPKKTNKQVLSEVGAATESILQYALVIYPDRGIRAIALLYAAVGETARLIPQEAEERVLQLLLDNVVEAWEAAVATNEEYRNAKEN